MVPHRTSGHGTPRTAELLLCRARVLTLDPQRPRARAVAIGGGRILAVGEERDLEGLRGPATRTIDCQGMTLVPGLIDAHCHFLPWVEHLVDLYFRPTAVTSIPQLQALIRKKAQATPPGQWIKAWGYHEACLREQRHPHRHDLDAAAPCHPVKLNHVSGHGCVLNSLGLEQACIHKDSPAPPGALIERDQAGEPTGLLWEMNYTVDRHIPPLPWEQLREGVRKASRELFSLGITSIHDATLNTLETWGTFQRLREAGEPLPRVYLMIAPEALSSFLDRGLTFGSGDPFLRLGSVKIYLTRREESLYPYPEELQARVLQVQQAGFQVALHAVEGREVEVAAMVLGKAVREGKGRQLRHRVEHAIECPPQARDRIKRHRLVVVTQPAFLYYERELSLSSKYSSSQPLPLRSLLDNRVGVAASSDLPVVPPSPLLGLYAAVTRRSREGRLLGGEEGISAGEALAMHTLWGAYAALEEGAKGSITPGKLADLVLLSEDPTQVPAEAIPELRVRMTILGGHVVWAG